MKTTYLIAMGVVGMALALAGPSFSASETDNRIESSVKDSYIFKTYLKDDDVNVRSKNGNVDLTGTVSEESHKSLAKETASNMPGVKKVDNQIEVKGENPPEHSDAWLTTKVKTALMFHRNVSGLKTDVDVKNGVVTLKGEAESQSQKELTTEYAKDIEGVKDVKNEMVVAQVPQKEHETLNQKIDDASVTAQVKMALLTHRSTSFIKTKVETNNGVVTATGTAKNDAEKALVTKLVEDIKGVKSVRNRMKVEPQTKTN